MIVAGVASECACRRKFAEFMTYHVLCDVNRNEFVPVVYSDGMAYEIRRDHA